MTSRRKGNEMIPEDKIRAIIEQVPHGLETTQTVAPLTEEPLADLAAVDGPSRLLVPKPVNRDAYLQLKATTPARVGIWRSGPRYLTAPWLRFRADHALAQDAVFKEVPEDFFKGLGLFEVQSQCGDKDQFLTRPDLGRQLDEQNLAILRERCQTKPKVQLYIADGLSSTAVECNAEDAYRAIEQGLNGQGITLGTPFFLRYGRVRSMEAVARALQPEVTAVLIGERPGLASAESMSCYLAYRVTADMPESQRTVISNIHRQGTPAVEAGAYIAEVIKQMLEQQASGLALKL
jgi:ethanolamine ammonia-lyase small subunit